MFSRSGEFFVLNERRQYSMALAVHFQSLGVAEVWRFNGRVLTFCILGEDGQYADQPHSKAFPFLRPEHFLPYLNLPDQEDETRRIKNYVRWLREHHARD